MPGRPYSTPGTPLFPLVQSGGEEPGAEVVDELPEVELGRPEELVVRPAGEQFAEPLGLPLGELEEQGGILIGLELLLGGQWGAVLSATSCN
jgi:hypothetical protein